MTKGMYQNQTWRDGQGKEREWNGMICLAVLVWVYVIGWMMERGVGRVGYAAARL